MGTSIRSLTALRLVALSAVGLLLGCTAQSAIKVDAGASPLWSARRYVSYRCASAPTPTEGGPLSGPDLSAWDARNAIERELALRGFVQRSTGPVDFVVEYYVTRREAHTETIQDYYNYRAAGGTLGVSEAFVLGYEEGVITIDLRDADTRDVLWQGRASILTDPKRRREQIDDAIRQLFARLPTAGAAPPPGTP